MENDTRFVITFRDETLIETGVEKELVDPLMSSGPVAIGIWVLSSDFGILDGEKESQGVLKFWKNGEAVLDSYQSDFLSDDIAEDLVFLNMFLEKKGWRFVIGNDLRDGNPAVWNRIIGMVFDIVPEDFLDDYDVDEDEEIGEDMSFIEYERMISTHRRPEFSSYKLIDFEEFRNHTYDFNKRAEEEKNRIF